MQCKIRLLEDVEGYGLAGQEIIVEEPTALALNAQNLVRIVQRAVPDISAEIVTKDADDPPRELQTITEDELGDIADIFGEASESKLSAPADDEDT